MNKKLDFRDILASTLHDTKNSLGILFNTLEEVIEECRERNCAAHERFYILQYEVKRLNNSLIRLLSLYKAEESQFAVHPDYYCVSDFLEDVAFQHKPLLSARGIDIFVDCPEELFWTFDRNLVSGVLDHVLNNAFNYTKDKVLICAGQGTEGLVLKVEDNGDGYPDCMIFDTGHGAAPQDTVNFNTGNTGLGLYFSMLVANSHVNAGREGHISVKNGGVLGGGVFSIFLP